MKKIGGIIEGLILLTIGAYAGLLIFSGNYWRFLNPKFIWLTAITAVILMLVGAIVVLKHNQRPSLGRISVFLILLIVLISGNLGRASHQPIAAKPRVAGPSTTQCAPGLKPPPDQDPFAGQDPLKIPLVGENDKVSRVTMDGHEYVRINLAELYTLCKNPQPGTLDQRFVVRGIVHRNKRLDRLNQFGLLRTVVFCCLADCFGVGFRVQAGQLNKLADGQWVEVYGTLKRSARKLLDPHLHIEDMRYYDLSESCVLVPTTVIPITEPGDPYIFECRTNEPFAF
jgi:uncharacterized repeat protein (TIGR03943 family)